MARKRKTGKRGRPSAYRPALCNAVIRLGMTGASKYEMARALGVSRQTLENWAKSHAEFLDAYARAREAAQAHWEEIGQQGMCSPNFDGRLWMAEMVRRFPEDYSFNPKSGRDHDLKAEPVPKIDRRFVRGALK